MRLSLLLVVALAMAAQAQPRIAVSDADLSFGLDVGQTASRALTVSNTGTGALDLRVRTVRDAAEPVAYAFDHNSNTLYGVDLQTGEVLSSVRANAWGLLAFDGRVLYALNGLELQAFDPVTGDALTSVTLQQPAGGYYYYASDVAVSDGRLLVTVQDNRGSMLDVYDAATGALLRSVSLTVEPSALAAGDGVFYVAGQDPQAGSVLVTLDAATGARQRVAAFPRPRSLSYSASLDALVVLDESSGHVVRLYDPATGAFRSAVDLPKPFAYAYYASVGADEGREASWLTVSPRAKSIPGGSELGLTVTVDTRRLVGGGYSADLVLASNDPSTPEVVLPVTLAAQGVPAVAVRPGALAFGASYVGTPVTRTLTVSNPGSDTLRVASVTASDARLAVAPTAFELLPGDSLGVAVTLTPANGGALDATLELATNVPGTATVVVSVTGTDAFPPRLEVAPTALAVTGDAGEATAATLTLTNSGQGPLTASAAVGLVGTEREARPRTSRMLASSPPPAAPRASQQGALPDGTRMPTLTTLLTDARSGEAIDIVAIRGAIDADSLYLAIDLAAMPADLNFTAYLDLDTDANTGWEWYGLGVDAEVGGYAYRDAYTGVQYGEARAYHHTLGMGYSGPSFAVRDSTFWIAVPVSVLPGAEHVFDMVASISGSRIVGGSQVYGNDVAPKSGVLEVRNAPWLSLAGATVTVPAGESRELALRLDATDLLGGSYPGRVVVVGNGPEPQTALVPVTFDVVGVPEATASPLALGTVYVGYPARQSVVLRNTGTDVLTVSAVASSSAAVVAALPAPLQIAPGASASVPVDVTASAAGGLEATLTFTTNAPAGSLAVPVTASALEPPVAGLSVSSLDVALAPGETSHAEVTLANTGQSALTYQARVVSPLSSANGARTDGVTQGLELAEARTAALARAGRSAPMPAAAPPPVASGAALPTLLVDPDEGLAHDVVEIRGQTFPNARVTSVELVFARDLQVDGLEGLLLFDTDRTVSTGYQPYVLGEYRSLGVDLEVNLYGIQWGQVYVSGSGYGQYVAATVSGRSLRFNLPMSLMPGEFDFVGYTASSGVVDAFPDTGVSSADARLGWLSMAATQGSLAPGASSTMRIDFDPSGFAAARYAARVQITTNDPARPVLELPVSLLVQAGVASEEAIAPAFSLMPPAPNPTQGTTRLRYGLEASAPVVVEVYDAVGRRVHRGDEGTQPPGEHSLVLETRDWPTGVYVVRLLAGSETATQRLSVVR